MSSIVKAINLSFKSFSRLYLAERFSLKEEGKSGFSFEKGLVTPAGSREALENEAETKSFQHGLSSCPTSMSPVHTRVIWMFGNQASIGNSTEGSAWPPQRTLVSHPGEMPPQFSCHQGAPVGGQEPGLHASVPQGGGAQMVLWGATHPFPQLGWSLWYLICSVVSSSVRFSKSMTPRMISASFSSSCSTTSCTRSMPTRFSLAGKGKSVGHYFVPVSLQNIQHTCRNLA